jgi:hypothetical protein
MRERMEAGGGLAGWLFGRWTYEELLNYFPNGMSSRPTTRR